MGGELDLEGRDLDVRIFYKDGTKEAAIKCQNVFFVNALTHSGAGKLCKEFEDEEVGVLFVNPDHISALDVREAA